MKCVSPSKAEDEVRGLVMNLGARALPFGSFENLPSG